MARGAANRSQSCFGRQLEEIIVDCMEILGAFQH
jgi:hypothetical protein